MDENGVDSLEAMCLDEIVNLIPFLGNQLHGLPLVLLNGLIRRCDDYRLALVYNVAVRKGLDIQVVWRERCKARFLWSYRHKFKSNLHDAFWECCTCLAVTPSDPPTEGVDWYQIYMDKICEENLEKMQASSDVQYKDVHKSLDEETNSILKYPFLRDSAQMIDYKPHQLLLNIKTVVALTRSPKALGLLAEHLHTFMCRVQIPTKFRELATSSLERFVRALLAGGVGKLDTVYIKEQEVMRGEAVNYASLFNMLLLGKGDDVQQANRNEDFTEEMTEGANPPGLKKTNLPSSPKTSTNDDGCQGDDLYDFCFKEPVKTVITYATEDDDDEAPSPAGAELVIPAVHEMFCEEGATGRDRVDCLMIWQPVPGDHFRDQCCHYVDPDNPYFQHIPDAPDPRPNLGHSISNLVLVYIRLNPVSCSALANCLAQSTSLHSFALIQCVMPFCGWCEVMSGLAVRAQKGLTLDELALTCSQTYRSPPKSLFGQYCAHKLNEMLEAFHMKKHKMKSLKLELLLSHKCNTADNSYLPKYLPSISCLTLNCWGRPLTWTASAPHPLHQLVLPADLAHAIRRTDCVLTDLLLENSSLDTEEVDCLLAAAAESPLLKRISVRRNKYSTSRPIGLLALLHHPRLRSLDMCQCKFSFKVCEKDFQDSIVDALIQNCSLQHLNISDRLLDDEDLAILSRAFSNTKRTHEHPGYCLNICLSFFSSGALLQFGEMLSQNNNGRHGNKRRHSLDHLSLDWRCVGMIQTLKKIIPNVTCPHRLS